MAFNPRPLFFPILSRNPSMLPFFSIFLTFPFMHILVVTCYT